MNDPKVTVITPTYNHEKYIAQCIKSVIEQSYQSWEQIIIDDGSSDKTWDIISMYARQDDRIIACKLEHQGIWKLGSVYNTALSLSSGEYIAILEGDDWWPQDKLDVQVSHHLSFSNVIFSGGRVSFVDGHNVWRKKSPGLPPITSSKDYLRNILTTSGHFQPVSIMINRTFLGKIGGFAQPNYYPAVDYPTLVKLSMLEGNILNIDHLLGFYRIHSSQVSANHGIELIEGRLRYSIEQYTTLDAPFQANLHLSQRAIIDAHKPLLSDAYLVKIRHALIESNTDHLFEIAPKLWAIATFKRKIQVIYARFAIKCGFSMEMPLKILGWFRLRRRTNK